jgi:hypothetical protein
VATERWTYEENPSHYNDYNWASDELPPRKFYLFIAEIGRRVRHLMTEPGPIAMIGFCEQCAEGQITEDEISDLSDEHRTWKREAPANHAANQLYYWVADRYKVNTRGVHWIADECPDLPLLELVRDIYGPDPFNPPSFDAAWRTSTAVAIAQQMYESRDFGAMPILADALQDAGCDNEDVLDHCRDAKQVHVRGCWVVDLVLGKS